jgi:hypothetical protein
VLLSNSKPPFGAPSAAPGDVALSGADEEPIWKVTFDPNRSQLHTTETVCGFSVADLPLSGDRPELAGCDDTLRERAGRRLLPVAAPVNGDDYCGRR